MLNTNDGCRIPHPTVNVNAWLHLCKVMNYYRTAYSSHTQHTPHTDVIFCLTYLERYQDSHDRLIVKGTLWESNPYITRLHQNVSTLYDLTLFPKIDLQRLYYVCPSAFIICCSRCHATNLVHVTVKMSLLFINLFHFP